MGMLAPMLLGGVKDVAAVVLVFVLLIVFHELGHFWVAKRVGILVREFALGFGPKIFRIQRGETKYSLRLFPLGGFVDMAGETPQNGYFERGRIIGLELDAEGKAATLGDPALLSRGVGTVTGEIKEIDVVKRFEVVLGNADGERTYAIHSAAELITEQGIVRLAPYDRQFVGKPIWARAITIIAGPLMNFALAAVLFIGVNLYTGIPVSTPSVGSLQSGFPAQQSGIQVGDQIVAVGGTSTKTWSDLVTAIEANKGQRIMITVKRANKLENLAITPKIVSGHGLIGIGPALSHNVIEAAWAGLQSTWTIAHDIVAALTQMISNRLSPQLAGPVGIVTLIGHEAQIGMANVLEFAGFLSINLGIFNLLPIPALDGSRLVFLLVEAIRGKPVDPQKEGMVHLVGFALLMAIFVLVTYHDVTQLAVHSRLS